MSYPNLLAHLHRVQPAAPVESIQSALAFHIANLSPLPTPLVATAITCPLFLSRPLSLIRLQALSASFRHALHLKLTLLSTPSFSLFERSISTRLTQWTRALIKGLHGGNPLLRFAAANGILLALEDLRIRTHEPNPVSDAIRAQVEDQVVIAFAEAMDEQGLGIGREFEWESEFQSTTPSSSAEDLINVSSLTLSLILASQSLPLVASQKLQVLPLTAISQLLTSCIADTFNGGKFLPRESASSDTTALATLRSHIAALSRLDALVLSLILNCNPREGLCSAQETLNRLLEIASRVEGGMPRLLQDAGIDIATTTNETSASSATSWLTLKTLLFSTVMISDSVLSASIYIPPTSYYLYHQTSSLSSPATLAQTFLLILSRLSFVVSQFGGISSMGVAAEESSFKEMRKTAYLALDILASQSGAGSEDGSMPIADRFVDELASGVVSLSPTFSVVGSGVVEETLHLAQISFALACIEQLVSVLGVEHLKGPVWALVEASLSLHSLSPLSTQPGSGNDAATQESQLDQLKRQVFESAHSVVLAMFAANAANVDNNSASSVSPMVVDGKSKARELEKEDQAKERKELLSDFCTRLVPFYAKCLIENSGQNKLSTPQLRIAYAALVRSSASISASASSARWTNFNDSESNANVAEEKASGFTLAWYCIEELLGAIQNLENESDKEQKHRLHLTLISCVSSLPLSLLGRVLEEIHSVLRVSVDVSKVKQEAELKLGSAEEQDPLGAELVQALYREVLEVVGDREKEYVLRWWSAFATESNGRRIVAKL